MPINSRVAVCDICGETQGEQSFNAGWPSWLWLQGIGAVEPGPDEPIENKHREMWICPKHKEAIAQYLDEIQEAHK